MKNVFSILIVEDHQLSIDAFRKSLDVVQIEIQNIEFQISEAKNCEEAYDKVITLDQGCKYDLVMLDISLPPSKKYDILNGEILGQKIKKILPDCRFFVCTAHNNNFRLNNILQSLNPEVFLIKPDIDFADLVNALKKILNNGSYYSETILNLMRKKYHNSFILDELDVKILYEISIGANMKELIEFIPLSRAGIEKRKRLLKNNFKIKNNSDRALVLAAKEKGYL